MNKQKRRTGRAIRKQRREQAEMLAAVESVDWAELIASAVDAFAEIGKAVAETAETMSRLIADFVAAYAEALEQEYRMTYRALTTGKEVSV